MDFRENFSPVSDDKQVPPFEEGICPLEVSDVLEDIANVESFFLRHLVFSLHLPNNTNQVKQCVFNLFIYCVLQGACEVLAHYLLDKRVANTVKILEQLFD